MRTLLIIWILLSAPLTVFYIGWGLMLVYETAGMGAFLFGCVSLFTGFLAIAHLFDKSQGQ
jgi:hypothetical protein